METNNKVELTISDRIATHPAYEWAVENKNTLFYILLGLTALSIFAVRYFNQKSSLVKHDYIAAETAYTVLKSADSEGTVSSIDDALSDFQAVLSRQPDLQAKYDGPIAQILIARGLPEEAAPYASRAADRIHVENAPLFDRYSATSMVIANQNYDQALSESLLLQEQLKERERDFPTLFVLNTLRVASLQTSLSQIDAKTTWKEFRSFAEAENASLVAAYQQVVSVFQEGAINLSQYIDFK